MLLGDFERAWRESDAIRDRDAPDPNRFWNGEDVRGKDVIVRCLHGFGDAIQYLRFVPALRRVARRVIVEVPPAMVDLAHTIRGVEDVITWGADAPVIQPHWDVQIEVTELPYFFRCTLKDLPIATNYICLPHSLLLKAAAVFRKSPRPRVGLVWSAGEWNPSRSIPLEQLRPLFSHRAVDFWNLEGGTVRREWDQFAGALHLRDAPEFCADAGLLPLAAFVAQLDLVFTVDTLAAHLAGALNVPAWVMLQAGADWRWMVDRNDSPWYPSIRIFRQAWPGAWRSIIQEVDNALVAWLAEREQDKQVA